MSRSNGPPATIIVDTREQERVHDHDDGADEPAPATLAGRDPFAAPLADGWVRLAGRSRENRLVHLAGPASLLGGIVDVRIEAAGPYSLRGILA